MTIFKAPVLLALNNDGTRISGAKIYTYEDGSTTPLATYTDVGLTVASSNPIVADSDGEFPIFYLDPTEVYKFRFTDGTDAGNDPDNETDIYPIADDYEVGSSLPYDFTIGASGTIGSNQVFLGPNVVRVFTLPVNFAGSLITLETAPSAETIFSVQVDSVEIGTATFAAASQSAVLVAASIYTAVVAEQFDIVAPATINGAEGLRASFLGTYVVS